MRYLLVVAFLLCPGFGQNAANTAAAKQQVLWQKLEASIDDVDHELDGVMGVAIQDLTSGQKLVRRGDDVFPQASSIKTALLAELYRQAQTGKLGLTDIYTVQASDLVPDSDIMGGLTPGVTRVTLRDLATMMVAVSDNSATNVLIDKVGMDNVNALMDSLGLAHTRLRRKMMDLKAAGQGRENVSTPGEMMNLLKQLYGGKVLNKEFTDDFFKLLSTHKNSFLPRDLPDGLKIANKPGELEGVRNDSGVVFVENRPYVICVMTTYLHRERDGEEAISRDFARSLPHVRPPGAGFRLWAGDFAREQQPLMTIRRMKTYTGGQGYVYQYYFVGKRAAVAEPSAAEYIFDVTCGPQDYVLGQHLSSRRGPEVLGSSPPTITDGRRAIWRGEDEIVPGLRRD